MGLDITAYSNLTHLGKHTDGPHAYGLCCENDDHITAFTYDAFPKSFAGIPTLGTTAVRGARFLLGGCYQETGDTGRFDFNAGPYRGYGEWRRDLKRQFNPDEDPDGPFYELLWFADNEGCIGPVAARELLEDFRQHADQYDPRTLPNDPDFANWAYRRYADWTRAFNLAANNGIVVFP